MAEVDLSKYYDTASENTFTEFFANNFSIFSTQRKNMYQQERVPVPDQDHVFVPFQSLADLQSKLKSPFTILILSSGAILEQALRVAKNIALTVAHVVSLDFRSADIFFVRACIDIMRICYFVVSAIVDSIFATLTLISQLFASARFAIADYLGFDVEAQGLHEYESDEVAATAAAAFLETGANDIKISLGNLDGLEDYAKLENGFFDRFEGDFQTQFKAILVVPVSYLSGALGMMLGVVKGAGLAALNICVLDFELAYLDLKIAWHSLETSVFLALSAILETLYAVSQLVTRTLASIDGAVGDWLDAPSSSSSSVLLP